ncbi:MAG: type II secretion system protein GspG [Deltaproteobacteria bacterium]|nr:type II secretion system protein GspG [Deltaproteobacteria bacterium]
MRSATRYNSERGFTLIELIIVIAIITALASMFLPKYLDAQRRSDLAIAQAALATLRTAVVIYRQDTGVYPNGTADLTTTANWNNFLLTDPGVAGWKGAYTDRITNDPWGNAYVFGNHFDETADGDPISHLFSGGPNGVVDTVDFSVDAPGGDDLVLYLEGQKGAGGGGGGL